MEKETTELKDRSEYIDAKLVRIQTALNVPKNHRNGFGGYYYRTVSDILDAAKPLCKKEGCFVTLSDELVMIGTRYYVKSTAELSDGSGVVTSVGWAREDEGKKGMDSAQLTGATSSYARKYALNGLFAIDDTADIDSLQGTGSSGVKTQLTQSERARAEAAMVKNRIEFEAWQGKYGTLLTGDSKDNTVVETARQLAVKFPKQ